MAVGVLEESWDHRQLPTLRDVVVDVVDVEDVEAAILSVLQLHYKHGIGLKPSQT